VDVSSEEIRSSRFQGTRHVYDRREIDAFLHRTAATLEVYERKLAVTQAHVESLEKALDLAHSRARSVSARESRIAELEAALAAAQHNYESAKSMLESSVDEPAVVVDRLDVVVDARRRAEEILDEARQETALMRSEVDRLQAEGVEAAALALASSHHDADEIIKRARMAEAAMLDEVAKARAEAQSALQAELDTKRGTAEAEFAADQVRLAGDTAAAEADLKAKLERSAAKSAAAEQKSADRIHKAEQRARAAEAERSKLLEEIDRMAAEAEAERKQLMADAEQMVEEAVAQARDDRDRMLEEAQRRLDHVESERAQMAEQAAALKSASEDDPEQDVATLQRRLAQMRTALANIQRRFGEASKLSPEELELAAALVDLDLHDVDHLVDLTSTPTGPSFQQAPAVEPIEEVSAETDAVTVKSKWSQSRPAFAAAHEDPPAASQSARQPTAEEIRSASWRQSHPPEKGTQPKPDEDDAKESLGFYERRLAGLRARLRDAAGDDY